MRKQLNKSEVKGLNRAISELYGVTDFISRKDNAEQVDNLVLVNKKPLFFLSDNKPVPTLRFLLEKQILKTVTVDMGAVKFVTQGADVMGPGIAAFDSGVRKDEFVVVVDERNRKPLAVGILLRDVDEIKEKGKAIRNLHFVGDRIWDSI
jgi:PUA-domain protein